MGRGGGDTEVRGTSEVDPTEPAEATRNNKALIQQCFFGTADSNGFAQQQNNSTGARLLGDPNKLMRGAKTNKQSNK